MAAEAEKIECIATAVKDAAFARVGTKGIFIK